MKRKNRKPFRNMGFRKDFWMGCVVSLVLSLLSSASYDYFKNRDCDISILFFIRIIFLFGLYLGLFWFCKIVLSHKDNSGILKNKIVNFLFNDKISFLRQVFIIAGVILLLWIPYFVVSYPGNMSNDTTIME